MLSNSMVVAPTTNSEEFIDILKPFRNAGSSCPRSSSPYFMASASHSLQADESLS